MKAEVVLTVAESKRLIAKGVASLSFIKEKMQKGIIVVTTGSTNAYIYEELTGRTIDPRAYLTGRTTPAKSKNAWQVEPLADLVLVDGKAAPELNRFTALEKMQQGDVYIKGANALNYGVGVAGISIGHPTGGTIGGAIGSIIAKKLRFLIPVGLEKEVPFDIAEASALIAEPDERIGQIHSVWPVSGLIFTEIEALEELCGVDAYPVAAGGVAGAEGGLRLLLTGSAEAVRQAVDLVESIQGEPAIS
ncbi:MAG: hypothetical protein GX657_13110 [Chloroflexi bacterium]|jgi:hypothetical protein|nr:hypothetical protein [Chloroflexota bacterium]